MTEKMRKQPYIRKTGRRKEVICIGMTIVFVIAAVICFAFAFREPQAIPYTPPEFEGTAIVGTPEPDSHFAYGGFQTDYGFSFQMASNLYQQEDGSLVTYFTNPEENDIYLMLDIIDNESGMSLYRSGVLKTGEYIEKLQKYTDFGNVYKEVTINIYAFDPEHWYSEGTISITCDLQPW